MADINEAWQPIYGSLQFTNLCTEEEEKSEMDFKQGKNINIEIENENNQTVNIEGTSKEVDTFCSI